MPTKTVRIDPRVQSFWLTVGHLVISISIFLFLSRKVPNLSDSLAPFIAGVMWSIGINLGYIAIKHLGITRAIGIWVPVNILVGACWGLLYFKEAFSLNSTQLFLTISGIALLITAIVAIISAGKSEKMVGNIKMGILSAFAIGLLHGSVFVPMKASILPFAQSSFPFAIGLVATTSIIVAFKKLKIVYSVQNTLRMMSGGFILGFGNYFALLTIEKLGYSTGFALTQLAIVVNTLWGAIVFREISSKRGKVLITLGITVALAGAFILNYARPS